MESNHKKAILQSLHSAINNCDNKASLLLSAVGIVFGFSMFSIDAISQKSSDVRFIIYIVGSLYLLAFLLIVILLVLTVFPRRRIKKEKELKIENFYYHEDLYNHLKLNDLEIFVGKEETDDSIIDQIKNCSRIAHFKESSLRTSSILIVIFSLLLVCFIVLLFI